MEKAVVVGGEHIGPQQCGHLGSCACSWTQGSCGKVVRGGLRRGRTQILCN